jgi:hypothetical protein
MSEKIKVTSDEAELRDFIIGNLDWLATADRDIAAKWLDDAIATHTRPRAEAAEAKVKELERLTAALRQVWIDDYESVHWSPHMDAATKSKLHQDAEAAFEKWAANQQKETP